MAINGTDSAELQSLKQPKLPISFAIIVTLARSPTPCNQKNYFKSKDFTPFLVLIRCNVGTKTKNTHHIIKGCLEFVSFCVKSYISPKHINDKQERASFGDL